MNRTILIGRITKSLEIKTTQSNIPVTSFTLAVDKQFKDESGERGVDFIQCVVWRTQAENLVKYCDKGSLIAVDGRLSTRQYDTDNGVKYVTEVVCDNIQFLDTKRDEQEEVKPKKSKQTPEEMYQTSKALAAEEDLPF